MYSVKDLWLFAIEVSPFGNPRVKGYFHLTAAYRRLSRPSSALSAKAFTLRSFSLEQPFILVLQFWKFLFGFNCLSFANNCYLGCKLKDLCVLIHCCLSAWYLYQDDEIVTQYLYGKTLIKILNNKFFSIYNYLFVSYTYSVFNEHFKSSLSRQRKFHLRSRFHPLADFTFALAKISLRTLFAW